MGLATSSLLFLWSIWCSVSWLVFHKLNFYYLTLLIKSGVRDYPCPFSSSKNIFGHFKKSYCFYITCQATVQLRTTFSLVCRCSHSPIQTLTTHNFPLPLRITAHKSVYIKSSNLWIYMFNGKRELRLQMELRLLTSWLWDGENILDYPGRPNKMISESLKVGEEGWKERKGRQK